MDIILRAIGFVCMAGLGLYGLISLFAQSVPPYVRPVVRGGVNAAVDSTTPQLAGLPTSARVLSANYYCPRGTVPTVDRNSCRRDSPGRMTCNVDCLSIPSHLRSGPPPGEFGDDGQAYCDKYLPGTRFRDWAGAGADRKAQCLW